MFGIIKLFMLPKVVILSRERKAECFKMSDSTELSALFYCLIDGAVELSFMRFL